MRMLNFQARGARSPSASSAMIRGRDRYRSVGIRQSVCQMSTDERSQQLILLNEISGSLKSDGALRIRATVVGNMSEEPTACLAR